MIANLKPYPKMKDSGMNWLGDIPIHWEIDRAKRLFHQMSRPVRDFDEVVTCFRDGRVTLRKNRRTTGFTNSLKEIGYQGVLKGDLVIHVMDAFAGAVGISDSDGKCSPVYAICTSENDVDNRYYSYVIREMARSTWILSLSRGIRERSTDFRFDTFGNQPVLFPPIEEQSFIVRFIEYYDRKIKRYISAKQKLIKLLNEQKQAIINNAVTGKIDVQSGKPYPKYKPSGVDWLGDIPEHWEAMRLKHWVKINREVLPETTIAEYEFCYLDISSIGTGVLTQNPQRLKFINAPSRARRVIHNGDTIVSTVRTYLKSIYFFDEKMDDMICSTGFAVLTPRDGTVPKFVCYLSQSNFFTDQVMIYSVGIAYPAIAETKLSSLHVLVPPLSEQASIIQYLESQSTNINNAITGAHREIHLLHEFRARLISDVVTGKLDVREAAANLPDEEAETEPIEEEDNLDENQEEEEAEIAESPVEEEQ